MRSILRRLAIAALILLAIPGAIVVGYMGWMWWTLRSFH